LLRHRVRQEANEIAGVALLQGSADFTVILHAANAGSMTGTGIDHDERPL